MDDPTRAVLGQVDRRELIDLASALIRIPSFKTEETPLARFLDRFFRERAWDVDLQEIEPGRLQTIATLRGTGGGASLMLNGHTDINALTRRWRRDPWTPTLEGESWLMHHGYTQAEGVANLDGVPTTGCLVDIGYPKFKGGLGGYARYIAICPPSTRKGVKISRNDAPLPSFSKPLHWDTSLGYRVR